MKRNEAIMFGVCDAGGVLGESTAAVVAGDATARGARAPRIPSIGYRKLLRQPMMLWDAISTALRRGRQSRSD
jgi:hypothetical protein